MYRAPRGLPREGADRLSRRRYSCARLPPVGYRMTSGEAKDFLQPGSLWPARGLLFHPLAKPALGFRDTSQMANELREE
jgi:hypothetical protein